MCVLEGFSYGVVVVLKWPKIDQHGKNLRSEQYNYLKIITQKIIK